MTTKFSQGAGVQTLPPVCKSTVVLLPHFELPPYSALLACVSFKIKDPWDLYQSGGASFTLPWDPAAQLWTAIHEKPTERIHVQVWPYTPEDSCFIRSVCTIYPSNHSMTATWYGRPYKPGWPYFAVDHHKVDVPTRNETWLILCTA